MDGCNQSTFDGLSQCNMSVNNSIDPCRYISERNPIRFWTVGVLGPCIALIGILENIFVVVSLCSRKKNLRTNFIYLIFLAVADGFICLCYTPLIAMDVLKHYFGYLFLIKAWWYYFGAMLASCQVAMSASCFLILAATWERFLITSKSKLFHVIKHHRLEMCLGAVIFSLITKGPVIIEVALIETGCGPGFMEYKPTVSNLSITSFAYGTVYKFYFRNIATVFLPFTLLAYLNGRIVYTLRDQQRSARLFRFGSSDHKIEDYEPEHEVRIKVRAATRSLVLVVCTYLAANIFNVFITAWEHIDLATLSNYYMFYIYSTDAISLLTITACGLRLPIYWGCNKEIREGMLDTLQFNCPCIGKRLRYARDELRQTMRTTAHDVEERTKIKAVRDDIGTDFDQVVLAIGVNIMKQRQSKKSTEVQNAVDEVDNADINANEEVELEENGLLLNGVRRYREEHLVCDV